jgi:hypothetical protein
MPVAAQPKPPEKPPERRLMGEHVKVDRVACPWLIKKFVDTDAEFLFVPTDQVMAVAEREGATPYDVKDVELGHHGKECSFDAMVKKTHDEHKINEAGHSNALRHHSTH